MGTVDEILERVDKEGFKRALTEQRSKISNELSTIAASYSLEKANPYLGDDEKKKLLKDLGERMKTYDWAIQEIDRRLAEADDSLLDLNRAARRRAKKNKNGVKAGSE
jgi:hypothetical protein